MNDPTAWTCWRDPSHADIATNPDFGWPQCRDCGAAPDYHERPSYLDENFTLTLYVPTRNTFVNQMVADRSALVGLPMGERVLVYFEGWVNGPMQYGDRDARGLWEAGVEHAASRMVCQYPTSSMISPKTEDLTPIGSYNPTTHAVTITDERTLEMWLA